MGTQQHVYMVQHNGVTLNVVDHKLDALAFAELVSARHPGSPASITTLPRPANFNNPVRASEAKRVRGETA